jgi:hypothetical protein
MTSAVAIKPQKPWKASPRQRLNSAFVFVAAIATSYLIVALTPMKGKLAYAFVFFVAFTVFDLFPEDFLWPRTRLHEPWWLPEYR